MPSANAPTHAPSNATDTPDVRVFVLGQGWREDGADGIAVVGGNGDARGDVRRGRRGTAANYDELTAMTSFV